MRIKTPVVILVIVAMLFVLKYFLFPSATNSGSGGAAKGAPVLVDVAVIQPQTFNEVIQSTGTILANEEVNLVAEVSGRITSLNLKEGSNVKKGTLLVKINDAELRAHQQKLNASIKLAEQKLDRNKKLLNIQGISREEFDVLETGVEELKAERNVISAQIDKTEIYAPFDGVLGLRKVSEGAFVNSQQEIISIQKLNPLKLEFSIPEFYLGRVKVGDTVQYSLNGVDAKFLARVYAMEPTVDAGSRSVQIRAYCDDTKGQVWPGSFARVTLSLFTTTALLVPSQAIVPILKGKQVYVVRSGKADTVSVQTGVRNDSALQILHGLQAGDTIITTGLLQLRPGSEVKIRN
ncbi:MAG: efflux RND transporter periplasmic adaptor subunit [Bacteroidia bacterium]|jgi:membrane fusion protein (multidrug efflux system)|nr:efflux RND transporter periplasmic adaptor subunit [Bacteroidota bacterium]MBP6512249.1 efflux RND transporter periplasmic adaptor subunit [Bacteroidia bacterium]MBP7244205.1 efflux RND transporter periplasmic adaptor subunit [Bacteroidia bacterium]